MSTIHLNVFIAQLVLFAVALFWIIKKSPKVKKNKKMFLFIAIAAICYASIDSYFHRFLIASDFYYVLDDKEKSRDVAEKGLKYIEDKSEVYEFLYGRYSLYRKMKRAESKNEPSDE